MKKVLSVVLAVVMLFACTSCGGSKGLMKVAEAQTKLEDAYRRIMGSSASDWSGITDFAVKDATDEEFDQTFAGNIMGSSFGVTGSVKNGEVVQFQLTAMYSEFSNNSREMQIAMMAIPALGYAVFHEDIEFSDLSSTILEMESLAETGVDQRRLVEGDIEYAYFGGTNSESDIAIAMFTVRYLPAFDNVSYFDDED